MEIGQVVDYVIEYNEMHDYGTDSDKKPKKHSRKATQADWDAFWG